MQCPGCNERYDITTKVCPICNVELLNDFEFEIKGKKLQCVICGGTRFIQKESMLTPKGITLLGDWFNQGATNYICMDCGYIHWFMDVPEPCVTDMIGIRPDINRDMVIDYETTPAKKDECPLCFTKIKAEDLECPYCGHRLK